MKGIVLLAVSNIRRRKLLAVLMGVVLAVSAALLATSLGIVTGIARPVVASYERLQGSHLILEFDARSHDPRAIERWWNGKDGVRATATYAVHRPTGKVLYRSEDLGVLSILVERPSSGLSQDQVRIVEGVAAATPSEGNVWVPTSLAYGRSPPMKIGEILRVPAGDHSIDLRISAIIVDPLSSSASIQPVRLWVAPGFLTSSFPLSELSAVWFAVRLNDPGLLDGLWAQFQSSLAEPFSGLRIPYEAIIDSYLFMQRLIGLILLLFAAVSAAVILLILSFMVSAAILSDYRSIGILKAQGFTSRNIGLAYVLQYLIVALVSLPVGSGLSVALLRVFVGGLTRALGLFDLGMPLGVPIGLTVALIAGLVAVVTSLSARRVGRIRPAEAMRFGSPQKETAGAARPSIGLARLPVTVGLGLRQLLTDRRRSLLLLLSLFFTLFVLVFAVNTSAVFSDLGVFGAAIGLDGSDVTIVRSTGRFSMSNDELMAELAADARVTAFVPARIGGIQAVIPATSRLPARSIIATAYDGDMDEVGVQNIRGRNPKAPNEISLAIGTAREYERDIGDWFDIEIEGTRFRLLVTGLYQTTSNFGQGFRVPMSVVKDADPTFRPSHYQVMLGSGTDRAAWVAEYSRRFGAALQVDQTADLIRESAGGIATGMKLLLSLLAAVFASVSAIIVFNSTVIRISEQRSQLGVLKSIGMTQRQLAASQLFTILCLAVLAAAVALPVALVLSPRLLAVLGASIGLVRFPAKVSPLGTACAVLGCAAVALASGLAACRNILRITPRILIQE